MKKEKILQLLETRRKVLLTAPLMVLFVSTLLFWLVKAGAAKADMASNSGVQGLNLHLPSANLKEDQPADKLSFYEKAKADSLKKQEQMQNDTRYTQDKIDTAQKNDIEQITMNTAQRYHQQINPSVYHTTADDQEQKITRRISELEKQLNTPSTIETGKPATYPSGTGSEQFSYDVDKLEALLQTLNNGNGGDSEFTSLDGTLNKILDIQHPDRVRERLKEASLKSKEQVFTVSTGKTDISISSFNERPDSVTGNSITGFYSIEPFDNYAAGENNAIEAVVHEPQTCQDGSVVKLRLLTDMYVNGSLIPKDNFVYGIASLQGERLNIEMSSICYRNSLFPVKLKVFDMDGLPGIYVPGSVSRDVTKQSADNSLQLMELSSIDPSFKAQASAAGIATVKNLLGRKVKQVKVYVKAGYKVLLKDENQHY